MVQYPQIKLREAKLGAARNKSLTDEHRQKTCAKNRRTKEQREESTDKITEKSCVTATSGKHGKKTRGHMSVQLHEVTVCDYYLKNRQEQQ